MVQVLEVWDDEVGATVARHCRPRRLTEGELLVEVDDPTWATQLRFLTGELAGKINTRLGDDVVRQIEVRVARPGR